jgi:hypothetical protein
MPLAATTLAASTALIADGHLPRRCALVQCTIESNRLASAAITHCFDIFLDVRQI